MMQALATLAGRQVTELMQMTAAGDLPISYEKPQVEWEEYLQAEIAANAALSETEKQQLILARRGQGEFRKNVQRVRAILPNYEGRSPGAPAGKSLQALA